jgi:chromosome segregation ATPase
VSRTPKDPVAQAPAAPGNDKDEGVGISLFWRIFGGTLLSIAAMVGITLYQQVANQVNALRTDLGYLNTDLRKDLGRVTENYGELVKKEEVAGRTKSVWDAIKELRGDRTELAALKERCEVLLEMLRAGERERRQLARELQKLREQRAGAEERLALVREVQQLRERIARLQGRRAAQAVRPADHVEAEND